MFNTAHSVISANSKYPGNQSQESLNDLLTALSETDFGSKRLKVKLVSQFKRVWVRVYVIVLYRYSPDVAAIAANLILGTDSNLRHVILLEKM